MSEKLNPSTASEEDVDDALQNVQKGLGRRELQDKFMHLPPQSSSLLERLRCLSDDDNEE